MAMNVLTEREEKASVAIASNARPQGWTKTFLRNGKRIALL